MENFAAVYPERLRRLLFYRKEFTFFDSPHIVVPRTEKYVIWEGKPRQLGAVRHCAEKEKLFRSRPTPVQIVRTDYGRGEIYGTTLIAKIVSLALNKLASLDPFGVGIEMEADKPNWYDALNGLPGLFGSSISETLELKRLLLFVRQSLEELQMPDEETFGLYEEAADFFHQLFGLLREARAGLLRTYFAHEPTEYRLLRHNGTVKTNEHGLPCFAALKFRQISLPLFLEGLVHYLRVERDPKLARTIYRAVRNSGLFDRKLQMYKVNESLQGQPHEIGRTRTFSPGWLENESVWMHMEFKYLLELLRCGLVDEFYRDIRTMLPPFMDPARYGRSILENSSFIASSANPDGSIHRTGFVARLSGSTAEFIHMLHYLTVGPMPFRLDQDGRLILRFVPVLRGEMFTRNRESATILISGSARNIVLPENTFSFVFLGAILVVYHNAGRRNTYGPDAARPIEWKLTYRDGRVVRVRGLELRGAAAEDIRSRKVERIDVVFS